MGRMNLSERYFLMVDTLRLNANRIWLGHGPQTGDCRQSAPLGGIPWPKMDRRLTALGLQCLELAPGFSVGGLTRERRVQRVKRGQYRCTPANPMPALVPCQNPEAVV